MATLESIQYEVDGGVARITLDRPDKLNAFTRSMRADLLTALQRAAGDPAVRVVALAGAGRAFCAGGDVSDMAAMKDLGSSEEQIVAFMTTGCDIVRTLRSMEAVVVALVDGVAAGAGAALACACDLRWASERTRFVFSWTRLGLHPDWGASWTLPRLVGPTRALEWMLLGEPVTVEEARDAGLVGRVFPTPVFEAETRALLARLAATAPVANAWLKGSVGQGAQGTLDAALERELVAQAGCWRSDDCGEGIAAFSERRPARFEGHQEG